jgi:galactose-1-phosphate uridylyltransferase
MWKDWQNKVCQKVFFSKKEKKYIEENSSMLVFLNYFSYYFFQIHVVNQIKTGLVWFGFFFFWNKQT